MKLKSNSNRNNFQVHALTPMINWWNLPKPKYDFVVVVTGAYLIQYIDACDAIENNFQY